jgi:hypothetical protein
MFSCEERIHLRIILPRSNKAFLIIRLLALAADADFLARKFRRMREVNLFQSNIKNAAYILKLNGDAGFKIEIIIRSDVLKRVLKLGLRFPKPSRGTFVC